MLQRGFHYIVGKFKCIVISDGTLTGPNPGDKEVFGLNLLLVDTGDHKILIDTGGGGGFQPTTGHLMKNMEAEGIKCADIDRVILTHGHVDHVSGCYDSRGTCVFPNARFVTSAKEWEYWQSGPDENDLQNVFFSTARKHFLPVRDRFDLIEDNGEMLPGIKFIDVPGHSPGNFMVDISSEGERLLCLGDILHSPVEFSNPECYSQFDVAPEQALRTRLRVLKELAQSGVLVFVEHFEFPGLGYIRKNNGFFSWEPIP